MWKYAGELRVGDVWIERGHGRTPRSYRVIAVAPGLAQTTMRVTGECVTTGRRRMTDFFLVNRIEVHEDRSSHHADTNTPTDTAAPRPTVQLTELRAMRTNWGATYHAVPAEAHHWTRAICGAAPQFRSAGWAVTGQWVTCPRCQQRLDERTTPTGGQTGAHRENDRRLDRA